MPLSQEEAVTLLKKHKEINPGLTRDQANEILDSTNQRIQEFQSQSGQSPDEYQLGMIKMSSLPEEYRKSQLSGAGETIYQRSKNIGKEKPALVSGLEKAGGALGIAGQIALEAIGKKAAGKKGSAAGAVAATTLRGIARENFQDLTGYQDQPVDKSQTSVYIDAGEAAALDVVLNTVFDDIIPGAKKKVLEVPFLSKLVGKGKAAQEQLAGEVTAKAGKAYEYLQKEVGDVRQYFLDSGMGKIKWWEQAKNKYDKYEPLGIIVNKKAIADLSNDLQPILKDAGDKGIKLDYVQAEELFKNFRKNGLLSGINKSGLQESELKAAASDGSEILDEALRRIKAGGVTPVEVKKMATELYEGTFTSTGRGKTGLSPTAQRQVATMLSSWLKTNVDGAREILAEERKKYLLNDLIESMQGKVNKEFGKDLFANLSPAEIAKIAGSVVGGLGLATFGRNVGGKVGATMQLVGGAAAASQIPSIRTQVQGGPEKALFNTYKESVKTPAREAIGQVVGATGRTFLQRLLNSR